MNYADFGARIRARRKKLKLTQEQLAELAGISASFLGHVERGTRIASLDTLVTLCNVMQISPNELLCASLDTDAGHMPEGLNDRDRFRLREFLRLAQDTVQKWDDGD